jgi:hypothetical protein
MPLTPDLPFPKSPADAIRSKDWNDHIKETQRLDVAKVNRSGDAMTGPLTIAGALGIGTTAPKAPLHVVGPALISDGDGFAVKDGKMAKGSLTIGSIASSFGGGNGWNANTAGLMLETAASTEIAVHHSNSRIASIVQYNNNTLTIGRDMGWGPIGSVVMNGNLGVGVAPTTPGLKIDAAGRIRLRQAGQASAGLWLHQDTPNDDRAFVGMADDNQVGLYGKGIGWGLAMDINSGNVTIKGRCSNSNIRTAVMKNNKVDITTAAWAAMPDMSLTFVAAIPNSHFHITAFINGVQSNTPNVGPVQNLAAEFRLLLDGGVVDFTRHEFHQSGWELRGVFLSRLLPLNAGQHTVAVHWRSAQGQNTSACWYGDTRQIQVIEL